MLKDVSMKSLKGKVSTDERLLERVLLTWGVDTEVNARSLRLDTALARMQQRFFARSVWERLTQQERVCLFQVLDAAKNGIADTRLLKKVKLSQEKFEGIISSLKDDWVLIDEGEIAKKSTLGVEPVQGERAFFPYRECHDALFYTGMELFRSSSDRSHMSLDHLISVSEWSCIERLAPLCHVPLHKSMSPYHRESTSLLAHPVEIRKRISEAMKQHLAAFEVLVHVEPSAQRLFLWLCERGGNVSMHEAQAYLHGDRTLFFEYIRALEQHCLAFDTLTANAERRLFIPHDLLTAVSEDMAQHASDERTHAFVPLTVSPAIIRGGQPLLCYDLATLVGCMYQSTLERTKDDRVPKQKSAKIRPMLQGLARMKENQEDGYVDELFFLARHLEVLVCTPPFAEEKAQYQPGPKLAAWSHANFAEQMRRFMEWWTGSAHWYDVRVDGHLIYPSAYTTNVARKTLIEHLKRCIPERWYSVYALLFVIWKQQPIQIRDVYGKRLEEVPSLRSQREMWMQSGDGRLYTALLCSTLYEAGLVSLGYTTSDDADPDSFQLTSFGASVLADEGVQTPGGTDDAVVEGEERVLVVQPSFEILLLQEDVALLYQLLQWAEVQHVGPVSTFTLTQRALLRGLAMGISVEAVLGTLKGRGQKALPQNVEYTMREWSKHYKEAKLSEVMLVELSDERGQQDLYRALEGQHTIEIRALTPTIFAVLQNGVSFGELRKLLEKVGIVVRGQPAKSFRLYR